MHARATFLGRVPQERAAACYAACDVLALPVVDRWFGLEIEGLQLIPEFKRVYPRDWLASQLLGVTGTDGQGLAGLEYSLDEHLRGLKPRAGVR